MKAQFLPLFNVNLSQLNLYSISTKLPLNLISTSFQPQVQINLSLNSTSTITSTQYGCDIKATQSCFHLLFRQNCKNALSFSLIIFQFEFKESNKTEDWIHLKQWISAVFFTSGIWQTLDEVQVQVEVHLYPSSTHRGKFLET